MVQAGKALTSGWLRAIRRKPRVVETVQAEEEGEANLVLASWNVHKCVGTDKRFDPVRTADVIAELDADIVVLQEADQRFGERAGLLDLERLHAGTRLVRVPVAGLSPKGHGWHGNMMLLREGSVRQVRQLTLPGIEPRGALVVDLDLAQGPLRVIAAHLGLLRHSRALQAAAILDVIGEEVGRPTVLVGDLNEWRTGRRSALNFLTPVFDPAGSGVPSFPSRFPLLSLDRVMGHPHDLVRSIRVHDTPLARVASDHLPVRARLML